MKVNNSKTAHYVIFIFSVLLVFFIINFYVKKKPIEIIEEDTFGDYANIENEEPPIIYGINTKGYNIIEDKLLPNQLLSDILSKYNVSSSLICNIEQSAKSTYKLNKLKANNKYTLFITDDSIPTAHYMEYDIDDINYVVYAFNDSIYSYLGIRPTDTVFRSVSGSIESSLWNAMIDNDVSPSICDKLADIYAWTVDFFGIKQGDQFNVLYEEVLVDGKKVGTGRILAADLNKEGKSYYAYYFENEENKGYFNEKGESLKKQFLQAPLKYKRISSGFTHKRLHPIYKTVRPHLGVDYAAPAGTPVHSVGNGTVIAKGWDKKGGGNYIKIKHNNVYTTLYMHLRSFAPGLSKGSSVKQGQLIGYVGSTGAATGPHLDFRVFKNNIPVNPLKLQPEPIEPIKNEYMQAFKQEIMNYNKLM